MFSALSVIHCLIWYHGVSLQIALDDSLTRSCLRGLNIRFVDILTFVARFGLCDNAPLFHPTPLASY